MPDCYIALGGNEGNVRATMTQALRELQSESGVSLREVSRLYRSAAVGPSAGASYENAAARLQVVLSPQECLQRLQAIERRLGRRASEPWGPRGIDLDLILYGTAVLQAPELTIPHPHCWYRRFVLDPLLELTSLPDHPVMGQSFSELRSMLATRPLPVGVTGATEEARRELIGKLGGDFRDQIAISPVTAGSCATLVFSLDEEPDSTPLSRRTIALSKLPGTTYESAQAVLTAALDEPQPHSLPLLRMP